jgi:hypothetical protein
VGNAGKKRGAVALVLIQPLTHAVESDRHRLHFFGTHFSDWGRMPACADFVRRLRKGFQWPVQAPHHE